MVILTLFLICLLKVIDGKHVYLASNASSTKITNKTHEMVQVDEEDLNHWYWGWYNIFWLRHRKTLPPHQIAFEDGVRILLES
jgi:hypothetical protein